jgi:hypothetical protein
MFFQNACSFKKIIVLCAVVLGLKIQVNECRADTHASYSIEDEALRDAPQGLAEVIKKGNPDDADWLQDCSFLSQPIAAPHSKSTFLFVTTKNACGWGAAAGPIYIVEQKTGVTFSLLQSLGGHTVKIKTGLQGSPAVHAEVMP